MNINKNILKKFIFLLDIDLRICYINNTQQNTHELEQ